MEDFKHLCASLNEAIVRETKVVHLWTVISLTAVAKEWILWDSAYTFEVGTLLLKFKNC